MDVVLYNVKTSTFDMFDNMGINESCFQNAEFKESLYCQRPFWPAMSSLFSKVGAPSINFV